MNEYFFKLHNGNLREGPGDDESTRKAFSFLNEIPAKPNILDIGCGPGMQTMELARLCDGKITALDFYQPFLDELKRRAKENNLEPKIETIIGSMDSLPFEKEYFDIIWSEGAVYIMGFEKGLCYWRDFVKPKGYIVVSEITWLKLELPKELSAFWESAYSEMAPISTKIKVIENAGLLPIGHFILPAESWWTNYYNPLNEHLKKFQEKYKDNPEARKVIEEEYAEQELFRKYSDYYNYVFYIMQKM